MPTRGRSLFIIDSFVLTLSVFLVLLDSVVNRLAIDY